MSFYDEYGDMRELDDFYSAIENALNKVGIPTQSEIIEKGTRNFPRFPNEYEPCDDLIELMSEEDLPF